MGTTSLDLYRNGNAGHARLPDVRLATTPPDIETYVDGSGVTWVKANTGGASTWSTRNTGLSGQIWRLPAGSAYSDDLVLDNDLPDHWAWAPKQDMTLDRYRELLQDVNVQFVRA